MEKIENMEKLPKYVFWICLIIAVFMLVIKINAIFSEKEQEQQAQLAQNPEACEAIKSFKYQAQCYETFIDQGYSCKTNGCFFAYALHIQDDWYCDKAFPINVSDNVPVNIECRVSVFIERYTNEGLRNCCHIE